MKNERNRVYQFLRQRLISGYYKCGFHLKEEPIAQELGVSRTPVRIALHRLVEEGMATNQLGQGTHVKPWAEVDVNVEEKFQLRMLLEPYASSLAASKGGSALIDILMASNQSMQEGIESGLKEIEKIQEAQEIFHKAILNATASQALYESLEKMIDIPAALRVYQFYSRSELKKCLRYREKITEALRSRNSELSSKLMREYLQNNYRLFKDHCSVFESNRSHKSVNFVQWRKSSSHDWTAFLV